jgi:predicted acyltransferase
MIATQPQVTLTGTDKRTGSAARLQSLDALRGFDMFWIISGEGIFHGLAAATGAPVFRWMSSQLHHSDWNGFTFYDMIFPLFIFIAGVSMPYSLGRQLEGKGAPERKKIKRAIYAGLLKRTLILIVLGMVVNGLLAWKGYENTRFASVLGRIALSCFFAAVIYLNCSLQKQVAWFAVLLLGYWAALALVPVPGYGAGVLTPDGNLSAWVDRLLLPGKLHRKVYDPEGLLSTLPAVASALLGVFTGQFLRWPSLKLTPVLKGVIMLGAAVVLLLAGLLWNVFFPINKNMWTSSFVLYAGGWSVLLFAVFYLVIDAGRFSAWAMPFIWTGKNSILIYMAAHGVINFVSTSEFLFGGLISQFSAPWQPVMIWTGVAFIQLGLLYFLYKQKWFLKV